MLFQLKKTNVRTDEEYTEAEKDLLNAVDNKCRYLARRITEIIQDQKNSMVSEMH